MGWTVRRHQQIVRLATVLREANLSEDESKTVIDKIFRSVPQPGPGLTYGGSSVFGVKGRALAPPVKCQSLASRSCRRSCTSSFSTRTRSPAPSRSSRAGTMNLRHALTLLLRPLHPVGTGDVGAAKHPRPFQRPGRQLPDRARRRVRLPMSLPPKLPRVVLTTPSCSSLFSFFFF